MAALTQMQLRYIHEEDRLLLRMNTSDEEEFRFWLTRRFTDVFYPLLEKTQQNSAEVQKQTTPHNKKAVLEFQEEKAKSEVTYNTTFASNPKTYPLGDQPLLITKASFEAKEGDYYVLQLSASDHQGVNFDVDQNLLHVFSGLIIDTLPKTNWQLVFETQATSDTELPTSSYLLN